MFTFRRLTARFGQWLQVGRKGRHGRQWQVAAGLISGQVKKCDRRCKLMRVRHVMRLRTQTDLTVALQRMGFSGRLNTAFIERAPLTVRHGVSALARHTWATSQQAPQLLAHLEWWRARTITDVAPSPIPSSSAHAATRARGQSSGATLPTTNGSSGCRQDQPSMDNSRGALVPLAAGFRLRGS